MIRSFVVGSSDEIRDDKIETWSVSCEVMLTLNVRVPANTPPNEPIFIDVGGPILPMDKISDNRWTFTYFAGPGTWNYKYVRGLGGMGHEHLDDLQEFRTVVISESDLVVEDEVQAWRWYPEGDYPPPYEFQVVEIKPRDLFINGIFFSDFWWPSITPLISASLDRLDDINADWVALAHGWDGKKQNLYRNSPLEVSGFLSAPCQQRN